MKINLLRGEGVEVKNKRDDLYFIIIIKHPFTTWRFHYILKIQTCQNRLYMKDN